MEDPGVGPDMEEKHNVELGHLEEILMMETHIEEEIGVGERDSKEEILVP